MTIMGAERGGHEASLAVHHSLRLILVIFTVSMVFAIAYGYSRTPLDSTAAKLGSLADYAWILGLAIVGVALAKALRLPATFVLGPMIISAIAHVAGFTDVKPDAVTISIAQLICGAALGSRLATLPRQALAMAAFDAVKIAIYLLTFTLAFVWAASHLIDRPFPELLLAFAPGGLVEMGLIALSLGADTGLCQRQPGHPFLHRRDRRAADVQGLRKCCARAARNSQRRHKEWRLGKHRDGGRPRRARARHGPASRPVGFGRSCRQPGSLSPRRRRGRKLAHGLLDKFRKPRDVHRRFSESDPTYVDLRAEAGAACDPHIARCEHRVLRPRLSRARRSAAAAAAGGRHARGRGTPAPALWSRPARADPVSVVRDFGTSGALMQREALAHQVCHFRRLPCDVASAAV